MAVAEAKKLSSAIEDDPKIVAGALEGLAEHRAGKGKSFDNVDDLKSYLEKPRGAWVHLTPHTSI